MDKYLYDRVHQSANKLVHFVRCTKHNLTPSHSGTLALFYTYTYTQTWIHTDRIHSTLFFTTEHCAQRCFCQLCFLPLFSKPRRVRLPSKNQRGKPSLVFLEVVAAVIARTPTASRGSTTSPCFCRCIHVRHRRLRLERLIPLPDDDDIVMKRGERRLRHETRRQLNKQRF